MCLGQVKISRAGEANDPYEFDSLVSEDPEIAAGVKKGVAHMIKAKGIVCFSRTQKDPVLWAHYAENHAGVCLGFDVADELVIPVRYTSRRLTTATMMKPWLHETKQPRNEIAIDLLRTKFKSWKYEQESRVFIDINEPDNYKVGMYFVPFAKGKMELREVVLGMKCNPTNQVLVAKLLEDYGGAVHLLRAELSPTKYEVIAGP